jgi:transposase
MIVCFPLSLLTIDDWATRKGQHYGTILIDLERHCVIDILPERDGVALKKWLEEHPGVEIVSLARLVVIEWDTTQLETGRDTV